MADDTPSIVHHVSIGVTDHAASVAFYEKVLATIGAKKIFDFPNAVAFGKQFPEFWVQLPGDGQAAGTANGTHFAFIASSKDAVQAFYDAALEAGGSGDGEPGPRPDYGPDYYGCFVRDLDGHKIEAAIVAM